MSGNHIYNTTQNKDDVLIRNIVVGTLHSMRDKITWNNTINSKDDEVGVPIYFTVAGSERFLSDIFLNEYKIEQEGIAESVYNKYPRAHVSMESIVIQEEYLANKFTRANYLKQTDDDEVLQYNAEFQNIPIKIDMQVTVFIDSIVDIFKCWEGIMKSLNKNVYYYVDTFNVKIPCHFFIPDTIDKERPVNFGFSDKKETKITFNIEVHADYPIFKEETEIFAGNRMNTIKYNIHTQCTAETATRNSPDRLDDSRGVVFDVTTDVWPTGNNDEPFYPDEKSE